ncbi:MAG TPA: DUF309 domain-containing protein [Anoxybacillus sp.]|jgi:uncharacterized protein|nr:DUF309 domain-containing protein [Anoxybacillus sp.]
MYPKAYIDFLLHFHTDRDYFECHEILEEHWKKETSENRQQVWVALIQIAVALYHHRRQNWKGAERMMQKALLLTHQEQEAVEKLGLDFPKLMQQLKKRLRDIEHRLPYESMNLPIKDATLFEMCQNLCKQLQLQWGKESDLSNEYLLHKHKLRDRTDVIEERERQKKLREKKKEADQ